MLIDFSGKEGYEHAESCKLYTTFHQKKRGVQGTSCEDDKISLDLYSLRVIPRRSRISMLVTWSPVPSNPRGFRELSVGEQNLCDFQSFDELRTRSTSRRQPIYE